MRMACARWTLMLGIVTSATVVSVPAVAHLPSTAQEVIDLSVYEICAECRLTPKPLAVFGADSGAGLIESDAVQVVYGSRARMYAVHVTGKSRIQLFDSSGRFVRAVGRRGRGPGEFETLVDVQWAGTNLVALDYATAKFVVLDTTGRVVRESPVSVRAGRFRTATDSTLVVGSMDRSRALAGIPLHLLRLGAREPVRHFGSADGEFNGAEPYADDVVVGWSGQGSRAWWGRRARFHLEEWGLDERHLRTIKGSLSWFPAQGFRKDTDGPPRPMLMAFGTDMADRLWLVVRVPDREWRRVATIGTEGAVLHKDLHGYVDTRVDVFDLRAKRHMGSLTLDDAFVGLVQVGNQLALARVVEDARGGARVEVSRLDFIASRGNGGN